MDLVVRPAEPADAVALSLLLNEIIEQGGTTAYEEPLSEQQLLADFIACPAVVSCFAAADPQTGELVGFQSLARSAGTPDVGEIATYARVGRIKSGIGSALFGETLNAARFAGLAAIDATIRSDNIGDLAYYQRMGFRDWSVSKGVPLADGTPIDRVTKRFAIG